MARIVIIGAAGFVGMELVKHLQHDHEVIAVARSNGKFLLQDFRCSIVHPSELQRRDDIEVVINLAYPTSGLVHYYPNRNKEILEMIEKSAGNKAHIIHVSTIAVFGFALDHPVRLSPVQPRRDYLYVESKIELEDWLQQRFPARRMDIIRLGNVWGRGSGAWTAPLIDKMLFGNPVGIIGQDGYCNATDVANVVDYITFIAGRTGGNNVGYHHLAELSHLRWSHWIDLIGRATGATPVYASNGPKYPSSLGEDMTDALQPLKPRSFYKKLVYGRYSGSILRSLVRLMPEERFARTKSHHAASIDLSDKFSPANETFMTVMGCMKRFVSHTDPVWTAPVSESASWERIAVWMKEIGYLE